MRRHHPAVAGVVSQIGLGAGRIDELDPTAHFRDVLRLRGERRDRRRRGVAQPGIAQQAREGVTRPVGRIRRPAEAAQTGALRGRVQRDDGEREQPDRCRTDAGFLPPTIELIRSSTPGSVTGWRSASATTVRSRAMGQIRPASHEQQRRAHRLRQRGVRRLQAFRDDRLEVRIGGEGAVHAGPGRRGAWRGGGTVEGGIVIVQQLDQGGLHGMGMPDATRLQHPGEGAPALLVDGMQARVVGDVLRDEGGEGHRRLDASGKPLQAIEQHAVLREDDRHTVQQPASGAHRLGIAPDGGGIGAGGGTPALQQGSGLIGRDRRQPQPQSGHAARRRAFDHGGRIMARARLQGDGRHGRRRSPRSCRDGREGGKAPPPCTFHS